MHRDEKTFDDFCEAVRTDPGTASWYTEKGTANNYRQLHRAWDRAGTNKPHDDDASDAGTHNDNDRSWRVRLQVSVKNRPLPILANAISRGTTISGG
jgi:hypothetical protein